MKKEKQNKSAECPVRNTGIGGQAVIEGVMMRGEQGMALAVRDSEGVIRVSRKRMTPLSKKGFWFNFPIIRGAVRFVCNMIDGVKTLMKSADVFGESEPSKAEKWVSEKMHVDLMSVVTTFSLVLGLALSVFLYIVLPNLILSLFQKLIPTLGEGWQQFILAFSKLAIMTAYLMLVSLMKDIKRTFMYHGAEHRTINCYEKGLPLTVENVQKQTTFHNRCGTTFLFLTILVSVFVSFLLGVDDPAWLRVLKRLATLPVTAGLAYELLKALAKTDFPLLYPLKLPGMLMQKITTRPPTDDMAEVAIASFLAALELDEDPNAAEFDFEQPRSYKQVRAEAEAILAGVDEADVDWIFCAALKSTRAALAMREKVSPKEYANIIKMAKERATGKPLQYILGNTCFYGYDFTVTPDVLIPRFETELLADYAIKLVNENSSVLDLCTGSGCIGITVQKKTGARVTLADISRKALAVAEQNAVALNAPVALVETDFFSNLSRSYDLITCNPPYIRTDDVELLSPTVRDYEPRIALDGGKDGLDCYRILAAEAARHLISYGYLLLEVGMVQAQDVKALL
ncbi:MAG: peptide chain release factor N(5)-glutamine methyltransferase [Clostridia bacterium]|nr:peptide chain release factor N(5)-glutamine methyltransferase [Clostridia bacterium]